MSQPKITQDALDPSQTIYADLPNHAASEAEFLALVDKGLASIEEGALLDHGTLVAELRQIIHGKV